ncbi:MAG: RsmB/NOP family class I SAM-dependent RNA methyltransferase [Rhodospirillaceae bacterium]|jgi:16S rRNA (cytosine967-C5)-methyltransferase|nr:RsmB/NOP family class I SAM-dependent RNA methyltransferase [Rhodospirillaceae bacterium]MBT3930741.1 RsmB/NOP family class I SAM-dependent RNA methyltransferase [Rhodospirillaceae bacterium]MBT4773817.1 RsmB/NOP family class I SAM-dependent RNA methyltransferase [Rhodospirillaceae bacterium]MBT5358823.1 RsmB/NOP family class I SAM-dependent RNA methyltransferase [Rhodospirillaceae bacterium]MBT5768137.1 RsmB/NOP family class I SAM-dependent RNA methyltransferase [Rhodospirillaceae bacterium
MTPAARTAATIDILTEISRGDAPADAILADWFRGHRFAGSGDRRAIREAVYADFRTGALRRWAVQAAEGDQENPRLRVIAGLTLDAPGEVDSQFDGAGYGPPPLSVEEQGLSETVGKLDVATAPEHVGGNCPADLYPLFVDQWGAESADELTALNQTAPVDLRVNALRATREEAQARLAADGYDAEPTTYSPSGLRGTVRGNFQQLGAYRAGMIDPQDESSQLVTMLVDAAPGLRVLDYCAGAGGKALALAAASGNQAEIVACDVSRSRLSHMEPRAARLGVEGVRSLAVPADQAPEELKNWADRVLIDAPCSGTGTWRRSPDMRWRTSPETIAVYTREQDKLLDTAATMLRAGGRIIYAVCSVLESEGRARVEAFLARYPDFQRLPIADILGPELIARLGCDEDLVLTPKRHNMDGMYGAVLTRRP